jgi:hypothetical protein
MSSGGTEEERSSDRGVEGSVKEERQPLIAMTQNTANSTDPDSKTGSSLILKILNSSPPGDLVSCAAASSQGRTSIRSYPDNADIATNRGTFFRPEVSPPKPVLSV